MNDNSAKDMCMHVNLERDQNMSEEDDMSGSGSGDDSVWVTDDEDIEIDEVNNIFEIDFKL